MSGLTILLGLPLCVGVLATSMWIRARRIRELQAYLDAQPRDRFWPGAPSGAPSSPPWRWRGVLLLAGGGSLVLALAGVPLGRRPDPTYQSRTPVVLLLDISRSMAVEDVPWGRLGAARLLARRVADRVPGAPLALTVFARDAYALLPTGDDRELLFSYLESLGPDMITSQGTSLEPVLREAARMAEEMAEGEPPLFLLLSDGESPDSLSHLLPPVRALRDAGGKLAVLAVGTEEGGPVPLRPPTHGLFSEPAAASSPQDPLPLSRANPQLLGTLASEGGGSFALAQDPRDVQSFLAWMEETAAVGPTEAGGMEPVDRWSWLAALAFLVLLVEASLPGPLERREAPPWS